MSSLTSRLVTLKLRVELALGVDIAEQNRNLVSSDLLPRNAQPLQLETDGDFAAMCKPPPVKSHSVLHIAGAMQCKGRAHVSCWICEDAAVQALSGDWTAPDTTADPTASLIQLRGIKSRTLSPCCRTGEITWLVEFKMW
jgi:hypothetical protein